MKRGRDEVHACVSKVARVFKAASERRRTLEQQLAAKQNHLFSCEKATQQETVSLARNGAFLASLRQGLDTLKKDSGPFCSDVVPALSNKILKAQPMHTESMLILEEMQGELEKMSAYAQTQLGEQLKEHLGPAWRQRNADMAAVVENLAAAQQQGRELDLLRAQQRQQLAEQQQRLADLQVAMKTKQDTEAAARALKEESAAALKAVQNASSKHAEDHAEELAEIEQQHADELVAIEEAMKSKQDKEQMETQQRKALKDLAERHHSVVKILNDEKIALKDLVKEDEQKRAAFASLKAQMQSVEKQLGETLTAAAFQQQTLAEQRRKTDSAEAGLVEAIKAAAEEKQRLSDLLLRQSQVNEALPSLHKRLLAAQNHYNETLDKSRQDKAVAEGRAQSSEAELATISKAAACAAAAVQRASVETEAAFKQLEQMRAARQELLQQCKAKAEDGILREIAAKQQAKEQFEEQLASFDEHQQQRQQQQSDATKREDEALIEAELAQKRKDLEMEQVEELKAQQKDAQEAVSKCAMFLKQQAEKYEKQLAVIQTNVNHLKLKSSSSSSSRSVAQGLSSQPFAPAVGHTPHTRARKTQGRGASPPTLPAAAAAAAASSSSSSSSGKPIPRGHLSLDKTAASGPHSAPAILGKSHPAKSATTTFVTTTTKKPTTTTSNDWFEDWSLDPGMW